MKSLTLSKALVALAATQSAVAHSLFTTLFVDGVSSGDGTCIRMPMTPNNATFPINDLAGNEMACGYDGMKGIQRVCPVNASSKLGFLFREYADASQPGVIDPGHKGPCAVYMKAVTSAINDTAVGNGWFKIWGEGYDNKTQQWCTEKLIQNNGMLSVTLPSDLAAGYYLARPELLALHQADKTPPNPQFYVGCAQIYLSSTQTSKPKDTVSIPGYVTINDPSVLFNIYEPNWPYPMPGPAVYSAGGAPGNKVGNQPKQNEGLLPENVVVTNANWWGVELDPYSTQDGCWNASEACFGELDGCYNTALPTGNSGCRLWEAKCIDIQTNCNNGNFNGPPNKGAQLGQKAQSSQSSSSAVARQRRATLYPPVYHPRKQDDPSLSDLPDIATEDLDVKTSVAATPVSSDVTVKVYRAATSTMPYSSFATTTFRSSFAGTPVSIAAVAAQQSYVAPSSSSPASLQAVTSAIPTMKVSSAAVTSPTNGAMLSSSIPPLIAAVGSQPPPTQSDVPITIASTPNAAIF